MKECFGRVGDGVGAVRRRLPAVKDALGVACHLLLGFEDGDGAAAAMRMPACEFEVLGVSSCECVANVRERTHRVGLGRSVCSHLPRQVRGLFAWLEADGVVVAQHDFYADNEIHFLPAQVVGGTIRDIGFGCGEAPCVHIRASVHSASRVEVFGCLGKLEQAVFVSHSAEQLIGMLQILAQVARHGCGAFAQTDAEVEPQFDFVLEGVSVSPYAVGKPETLRLAREECFKRLRVVIEIAAASGLLLMSNLQQHNIGLPS